MHEGKRVKVQVAVEVYAWSVGKQMGGGAWVIPRQDLLYAPVVPEVLKQWVAKEELGICVRSDRFRCERAVPQS
jgi:hypothetical protein